MISTAYWNILLVPTNSISQKNVGYKNGLTHIKKKVIFPILYD